MHIVSNRTDTIDRTLDLRDAGEEGEYRAIPFIKRLADRGGDLILEALARLIAEIACLDGPCTAEAFDHGRCKKFLRQVSRQRRRHQHDAEIIAEHALRIKREGQPLIGVERAFVEFVEDHAGNALQRRVGQDHAAEHALGDDLDTRPLRRAYIEARAQADGLTDAFAKGRRHAFGGGAGGDPAGFDKDQLAPANPAFIK